MNHSMLVTLYFSGKSQVAINNFNRERNPQCPSAASITGDFIFPLKAKTAFQAFNSSLLDAQKKINFVSLFSFLS